MARRLFVSKESTNAGHVHDGGGGRRIISSSSSKMNREEEGRACELSSQACADASARSGYGDDNFHGRCWQLLLLWYFFFFFLIL